MDDLNVCRFVPVKKASEQIHIINFVYETKYNNRSENKIDTCYKMAYVTDGACVISCRGKKETVEMARLRKEVIYVGYGVTPK